MNSIDVDIRQIECKYMKLHVADVGLWNFHDITMLHESSSLLAATVGHVKYKSFNCIAYRLRKYTSDKLNAEVCL